VLGQATVRARVQASVPAGHRLAALAMRLHRRRRSPLSWLRWH
jgi:hypothetical protein